MKNKLTPDAAFPLTFHRKQEVDALRKTTLYVPGMIAAPRIRKIFHNTFGVCPISEAFYEDHADETHVAFDHILSDFGSNEIPTIMFIYQVPDKSLSEQAITDMIYCYSAVAYDMLELETKRLIKYKWKVSTNITPNVADAPSVAGIENIRILTGALQGLYCGWVGQHRLKEIKGK